MKYFYIFLVVVASVSFITGIIISIIDKSVKKELERINRIDLEDEEDDLQNNREYAFTLVGGELNDMKKEVGTNQTPNYCEEPVMIKSISIDEYNKTRRGHV